MPHNVFPWRQGNRFALLLDGERFFPRMLELIAGAQRQVALELYLVESGACAAALLDGQFVFVGGTGATDEFWTPGEQASRWHEAMVEISGPLVADCLQLFERQWLACPARRGAWRPRVPLGVKPLVPMPPAGQGLGRVAFADALQHRDILLSLVRALHGAKQRIWLATPYFLPTWKVRRALRKAASRGVEVPLRSGRASC